MILPANQPAISPTIMTQRSQNISTSLVSAVASALACTERMSARASSRLWALANQSWEKRGGAIDLGILLEPRAQSLALLRVAQRKVHLPFLSSSPHSKAIGRRAGNQCG